MLHFFRKIRHDLIANNKSYKYFKYGIGEIVLVVLGILIALQINNWNENRNISKIELALLANLKNDINSDILHFQRVDSVYAKNEANLEMAIKLFSKAKTIKDIYYLDSLCKYWLLDLIFNHYTYDEMLSLSIGYSMKNKELQKLIADYYLSTDMFRNYIHSINAAQLELWQVSEIQPCTLLFSQLESPQIDLKLIDTSWIGNPNSPTYLALYECLEGNHNYNNVYRRSGLQYFLKQADSLKAAISDELVIRNK